MSALLAAISLATVPADAQLLAGPGAVVDVRQWQFSFTSDGDWTIGCLFSVNDSEWREAIESGHNGPPTLRLPGTSVRFLIDRGRIRWDWGSDVRRVNFLDEEWIGAVGR